MNKCGRTGFDKLYCNELQWVGKSFKGTMILFQPPNPGGGEGHQTRGPAGAGAVRNQDHFALFYKVSTQLSLRTLGDQHIALSDLRTFLFLFHAWYYFH